MTNKKLGILLLSAFLLSIGGIKAQQATSMRINEVLVINEDNFVDDYGKRHAWIELFNNSAGSVNIQGCYLTNDKNNPKKYPIPKGDVLTLIPPRQHTLFWADNEPDRGTFHINFTLDPSKENYIALYDADGKTLIDSVTIPANTLKADQSYARIADGAEGWEVKDGIGDSYVTPSTNNITIDRNEKIEGFKMHDKHGVGMSITAMAVVFVGLILLFLGFKAIGVIAMKVSKNRAVKSGHLAPGDKAGAKEFVKTSSEVYAAIGLALHEMQNEVHDVEETVLTIERTKRRYSPWNSKLYMMREVPNVKKPTR